MSTHTTNAIVQTSKLIALGDAIREKAGLSAEMTIDEMATAVENISSGSVVTRAVSFISNDANAMYYTDATMTPQSITSGSMDLNNVQMPVGSLVMYVRAGRPEPMPFPPSQLGVSQLASYTVGQYGEVTIYQVIS